MLRFLRNSLWIGGAWVLLGSVANTSLSWSAPSLAEGAKANLESQLKAALMESQSSLGELEVWQKIIFTEEVLPQSQRFIRNYRASSDGVKEEIDLDSLKSYLTFHASKFQSRLTPGLPGSPGSGNDTGTKMKLWVLLKGDPKCTKCIQSTPAIRRLAASRLDRRGLTPVWGKVADLPSMVSSGLAEDPEFEKSSSASLRKNASEIENQSVKFAQQNNAVGTLVLHWSLAPVDDADTAHADENHYILRAFLQVGPVTLEAREVELLDSDSFETKEARLLTDLFTELGSKFRTDRVEGKRAAQAPSDGKIETGQELLVEVTGVRDFAQYLRVKNSIQERLISLGTIEDRKFSRKMITFAFKPGSSSTQNITQMSEDIKKLLGNAPLDSTKDSRGQPRIHRVVNDE